MFSNFSYKTDIRIFLEIEVKAALLFQLNPPIIKASHAPGLNNHTPLHFCFLKHSRALSSFMPSHPRWMYVGECHFQSLS